MADCLIRRGRLSQTLWLTVANVMAATLARFGRDFGEVRPRLGRGSATILARFGRDIGEVRPRLWRDSTATLATVARFGRDGREVRSM